MLSTRQSEVFKPNILFWKVLGMWPEETSSTFYKYYCVTFVTITSIIYGLLFTLSLLCTPIELEIIVAQAMFYFTALASFSKTAMVIINRTNLLQLFDMLDCDMFEGHDEVHVQIVNKNNIYYMKYWKGCATLYFTGSFFLLFLPVFEYFFGSVGLKLPLCQYYFLSDHIRDKYYTFWFIYQFFGLFVMIMINTSVDTLFCGLLLMAITQYKVLNWKISNLKLTSSEFAINEEEKEIIFIKRFNNCLKHYDLILKFCNNIQKVLSFSIFVQFGTGAATICLSMCTFLRPMTKEDYMFMGCYIGSMILEIFLPSLIGAQLTDESQKLVNAAYSCDWISRSEGFKRSLRLMVERANKPIVVTGLQMFTLSLETFTSIIKTAYSFFTLLKSLQED